MEFQYNETSSEILAEIWACPKCGFTTREPLKERWMFPEEEQKKE